MSILRRYGEVKSLFVGGFVDLDAIPRAAKLFPEVVFLEGEHGYLRFSIDETSGWLTFEEVSSPSLPASLSMQIQKSIGNLFAHWLSIDLTAKFCSWIHCGISVLGLATRPTLFGSKMEWTVVPPC